MPRRAKVVRRVIPPDPKFQSWRLAKFINRVMMRGKKSVAERVVYDAMGIVEIKEKKNR